MRYDLLLNEINKIQLEYKELLIKLIPKLESNTFVLALDEINVFWNKKIDLINLYLRYYMFDRDTYIFTASTFLDVDAKEHFPFLLLGDAKILDDPLSKYATTVVVTGNISDSINEQIILTAKDNIKIIEECCNRILILPIRLMNETMDNSIYLDASEQFFCSLFDDLDSIKAYMKNCNTIEDICCHLSESAKKHIMLYDEDDISLDFKLRFKLAKENNSDIYPKSLSDGQLFFMMLIGHISQALDVLMWCLEYRCIPFIRYKVILHYIIEISHIFSKIDFAKTLIFKMIVANLVYNTYDKERLPVSSFEQYISLIDKANFNQKLFEELSKNNVTDTTINIKVMSNIIQKQLDVLYCV